MLYGIGLPLSRLLFDGATNPLTLGVVRYLILAAGLGVWVQWFRRFDSRLSVRDTLCALGVGVLFAFVSLGQLLSIARIPVSLTTLLFYTYPALTIAMVAIRHRRLPRPLQVVALAMASLGLVLVLDADLGTLDLAGVAFALLAAASAASAFLVIESTLAHADSLRATAASAVGASIVATVSLLLFSRWTLPGTAGDWTLMVLISGIFAAAVLTMFIGVARAGSVSAAMVLFLEPVTAIAIALLVLEESLAPRQVAGAVAVVIAVVIAAMGPRRA